MYAVSTRDVGLQNVSVEENALKAKGFFASEDFFNIFSFDLVLGDKDQVLKDKKAVVLSKQLAINLFDSPENALGQSIQYQGDREYQISGFSKNCQQTLLLILILS